MTFFFYLLFLVLHFRMLYSHYSQYCLYLEEVVQFQLF